MFRRNLFLMAAVLAITSSLLLVGVASAHNSACMLLPNGAYVYMGSGNEAHEVPEANPNRNDLGQLDLFEDPGFDNRDQYGVRFAAEQNARILPPNECPPRP